MIGRVCDGGAGMPMRWRVGDGAYEGQKITAKQLKATCEVSQFAVMHC
ncbi:Uncharacterised protein [Yersinia enterocolitica]|nr:Uncharacterised protein [Yersinia enterocolitica]CRX56104.1 Uncharacterised protein [Yersinia enterocolitica]